ncbi:MAG: circadian clock protein KaiC, partial [Verrucomicrobiaceae bacterium]
MSSANLPDALATGSPEEIAPLAPGRISTGMKWLDVILRGGIPENRVYLMTGDPGTGKTTLSLQFLMEGVRNGEKALYVTLAETREELQGVADSHGWDLSGVEVFEVAAAEQGRPEQDYTALYPGEVELGESLEKITAIVERVRPKRVVIDSLTEIRLLAREQVRYRRQIIALKNFLMTCGCTVYFVDDPASRGGADGQLQTICHGVISMERMAPEYGRERRRMQVLKMRGVEYYGGYHD